MTDIIFLLCLLYFLITGNINNKGINSTSNQIKQTTVCELPVIPYPKPAKYLGGIVAWRRYLERKLNYPQAAIDHKIEGIVRVQFTIDTNGAIFNVEALNDPGHGLVAEAVRMISSAPKWKPAVENGKPVSYRIIQTITFCLR